MTSISSFSTRMKDMDIGENTSPNRIFAINKYGFICKNCNIHYFNHYLNDDCRIFISCKDYNNYASLENMNPLEEVDKESLKNLIEELKK